MENVQIIQHRLSEAEKELSAVRNTAAIAQMTADKALGEMSAHERLCSERYAIIKEKMQHVPHIYEKLETLQKFANIITGAILLAGTGWLGIIVTVIYYMKGSP